MSTKNKLIAACLLAVTSACSGSMAIAAPIKVAFIGDQSIGGNSQAVLTLVANEGVDLLMIQGDLGYSPNAASAWNDNLTNALGSDFPVLAVVGNHENFEWSKYKGYIQRRIDKNSNLDCLGKIGVKAICKFGNIEIVQVAQGVNEVEGVKPYDNYDDFIRSSFASSGHRWRICSWHKNQKDMQAGAKEDSTGWDIYDACLDAGAMIGMAHSHSYSRTHLLSNFEQKTIVSKSSNMTLKPGQSFAFVSGLGGRDVVGQGNGGDWFASIYTASQGATHGALFCSFDISTADCYFKAIDGAVPDRFTLNLDSVLNQNNSQLAAAPQFSASVMSPSYPAPGYVFSRNNKTESYWIDVDASGNLGSIWITQSCAEQMGGASVTGDWKTLTDIGASFNSIESPCATTASLDNGYVYSRTDKKELRWVARNNSGVWGSIWIDEACANRLGGIKVTGGWNQLLDTAPGFDTIPYPCY